jgi:hypothetical protein
MPDGQSRKQSPITKRRFAFQFPCGAIRCLCEHCRLLAPLGDASIFAHYHNENVVIISRTHTTWYNTKGMVIKYPDIWNDRIYECLQQEAIRKWIGFGDLKFNITRTGLISHLQPSPSFRWSELERFSHLTDENPPAKTK